MSKEKKVLFVHDFGFKISEDSRLYTAVGLPEIYFDRFFDAGFNKVNILSRASVQNSENINESGFVEIKNKNIQVIKGIKNNYLNLFNPFILSDILKIVNSHDLIVISTPSIIGSYISILSILTQNKYSVEVAADTDMFSSKKFGFIVTFFLKLFMPIFVKKALGATYVTNDLCKRFPNEINNVSSNVNIQTIKQKKVLTKKLIDKKLVQIGFVGGITKRKGVKIIVKAIKLLVENGYTNLQVNLIGGHSDENWNEIIKSYKLEKYFNFIGIVTSIEVNNYLSEFDLYLQPSFSEGLPRASLEAMSHGLPVIATKLPGFQEILEDDFLIKTGDSEKLSELIMILFTNINIYNRESENNIEISKTFQYSILHNKRVKFYKKMIHESN